MGHRKRKPKGPPDSTHWSSYTPVKGNYWFHGGPWIPPEEVVLGVGYATRPESIRPHEKPATRLKSVGKMLDEAKVALVKEIKYYRDLHDRGVEALPFEFMKQAIREGTSNPNEPNHVHYQLSNAYANISRLLSLIPVYEVLIESIEPATQPLLGWNRKGS